MKHYLSILKDHSWFFPQHLRFHAHSLHPFRNHAAQRHFPSLLVLPGCTTYLEAESGQKLSAPPAHPTGRGGDKKPVKVGVVHPAGESMENAAVSPSRICPSCLGCGSKISAHLTVLMGKALGGGGEKSSFFPVIMNCAVGRGKQLL